MKYIIKDYPERYYMGVEHPGGLIVGKSHSITKTWDEFFENDYQFLDDIKNGGKFIGLECYPPDFKETKQVDYFVLCEVNNVSKKEGFISKKLPKGKYICFPIKFDDITSEIGNVYKYVKENDIKVSFSFDYEDYLSEQDYQKKSATLNFCLKLIEE